LAARASHVLLYVLMLALPLSGWLLNSAAGVPFRIFWRIPLPSLIEPDKHIAAIAALVHLFLFFVIAALLLVHIGAALRHHFIKHNDVLRSMLPTWKKSA
jgi:cytochrome b561